MRYALLILGTGLAALSAEPTYEQAVARWPDLRRPIAFLGCQDHPDEFAVMWNGNLSLGSATLTAADQRLFRERRDESLQVSFSVGEKPDFGDRNVEDGTSEPSLSEGHLPMARIRLRRDGATLLEEAFAINASGGCGEMAWNDPVFLRVRFTVEDPGQAGNPLRLWAQLARNHTSYAMETRRNVRIQSVAPLYGSTLRAEGRRLVDARGRIVLAASGDFRFHAALPQTLDSLALQEWQMDRNVCEFALDRRRGASTDFIVPFLPAGGGQVEAVSRLDYDQARAAVAGFWKETVARGMQVEVPEPALNHLWRYNAPLSFITADAYPNGDRVLKISPHHYEAYWPTPMSMNLVTLAQQGYLKEAAAYLEPFLDASRYRPVPNTGSSFHSNRGFISGPSEHLAISWVGDHGAILWAVSEYYLLTRDRAFLDRWLPAMLQGLEWIAREREYTRLRGGRDAGLMPAGRGTDDERQANFVWVDAWIYRGLASVCRVLEAVGHPDAAHWARERDDYRATFQKALRAQIQRTFLWTDPSGARIPFVPWELSQTNADNLHIFYLDGGPMFLGVAGLVDPGDETMTWVMKWFTEGPHSRNRNPDWDAYHDRPALRFEMSTVEPCYSWNVYLRFLRNEREKFLEGFYSLAAGSVSRRFLGGSEHRDGITNVPAMNSVINSHLRNMLVFEDEARQGLELLRNSPAAWIEAGKRISVTRAETYLGRLSYEVRAAGDRVEADIDTPARQPVRSIRLYLHHPGGKPLCSATVNGAPLAPAGPDVVAIPNPAGRLKVVARFD